MNIKSYKIHTYTTISPAINAIQTMMQTTTTAATAPPDKPAPPLFGSGWKTK